MMDTSVSQNVEHWWNQWIENHDEEAANKLIEHYMYIVDYHVERMASHIPPSFEKNDLRSLGMIGLFDALNKFEPNRNLKFSTYASIRIRGSIIDGLRKEDWLPRTLRERMKQIEKTATMLEQKLNKTPSAKEIAEALQIDEQQVEETLTHSLYANILSLESTVASNDADNEVEIAHVIEDDNAVIPEEKIEFDELKKALAENIKKLNENEQLVISLFYQEDLTLTEIGEVLNLTTSRISQIHKRAIFKLRKTLMKVNH